MTIDERDLEYPLAWRRELLEKHHPDKGGDPGQAAEINEAYDRAVRSGVVAP
jgi:hypothetical protein